MQVINLLHSDFRNGETKEMITMKLLGKVRRLYHRDRLSLSEIERRTGLTRKTIRDWLKAPEGTDPKYRRQNAGSKIVPFVDRLLKIDLRRPKRERRTALKLYAELLKLGFEGDYCRVTEYIRRGRGNGDAAVVKAFVPLQFEPGEGITQDVDQAIARFGNSPEQGVPDGPIPVGRTLPQQRRCLPH
jgi:transposase